MPIAALLLAGCGVEPSPPGDPRVIGDLAEQSALAKEDDALILCATDGGVAFSRTCTAERSYGADGEVLTIRSPDGGFRRLRMRSDGDWSSADGAERAVSRDVATGLIEIEVGGDRYRLPATR